MFKLKPLSAAMLGLALGMAVAHAEPPSPSNIPSSTSPVRSDSQNLTERSLNAVSGAAGKIGDVISTGALALGLGVQRPTDQASASASPIRSDSQNLTERSLTAVNEAAGKIGDVISTGALALGFGVQRATDQASVLLGHARDALGIRYRWGGATAQTGFDCSGFVRAVVQQTVGRLLPHHAADQAAVTQKISKDELQPGDLVFFNTVRRRAYSHVGIYMGDGQFIHAPSRGQTVRIDSLGAAYWQKRFEGARRVLTGEPASGYSLTSADTPDAIAPQAAASSAVTPAATASTAHDGPAVNAAAASLAGNVKIADAGPPGSPAVTATLRTHSTQPAAVPHNSTHAGVKHGRAQKQAVHQHGNKREQPAIDLQRQGAGATVAYAVGQAAASTATDPKKPDNAAVRRSAQQKNT